MNTSLKIRKEFLVLLFGFFLASCLNNIEEVELGPVDPDEPDLCETVSFAVNVKPIIDSNCIQCHGSGGNSPNLTSYAAISSSAGSVRSAVASRRMPQGGSLTDDEIQAIVCWVESGALDN